MSKRTITITHPNGESCSRKTDRDYQFGVVALISTQRQINEALFKIEEATKERDAWQGIIDGTNKFVANVHSSSRWVIDVDTDERNLISGVAFDMYITDQMDATYFEINSRFGVEQPTVAYVRDAWVDRRFDGDIDDMEFLTACYWQRVAFCKELAPKRIKACNAKIKKYTKVLAHLDSLNGQTYQVQSWHSRYDLAANAMGKYSTIHINTQYHIANVD